MPLRNIFQGGRPHLFGCILVVFTFVCWVLVSMPVGVCSEEMFTLYEQSALDFVSGPAIATNYTQIVQDQTLSTTSIVVNGTEKSLIMLPEEIVVVRLPDNRLALKPSQNDASLLPVGSTVSYYQDQPIVSIPDQSEALSVSKIVESPLKNFTKKTNIQESIQDVSEYRVQIVFFELARETPDIPIVSYSITWGDGSIDAYTADDIAISHTYDNSGSYLIQINVTDAYGFSYVTLKELSVKYEGSVTHSYLLVKKYRGPLAVFSSASLLLAVGLVAFTESGRYKLLLVLTLALPLYSRIQKEDVLDQFVRGQIYGFIRTNPGAHYNQIRRKVGVKNGTLSYHLGVLEKTELIKSRREGLKYRAFYPTGMNFPKAERFRLTELQIQIISSIRGHPGVTQKEISQMLGQKPQTINYNIKVLEQAELIRVVKKGRLTKCFSVPDAGSVGE